jgi:hypothetical protein
MHYEGPSPSTRASTERRAGDGMRLDWPLDSEMQVVASLGRNVSVLEFVRRVQRVLRVATHFLDAGSSPTPVDRRVGSDAVLATLPRPGSAQRLAFSCKAAKERSD